MIRSEKWENAIPKPGGHGSLAVWEWSFFWGALEAYAVFIGVGTRFTPKVFPIWSIFSLYLRASAFASSPLVGDLDLGAVVVVEASYWKA